MYPLPQNPTVKVFFTPDGRMLASTNVAPEIKVEVIAVTDLNKGCRENSKGLPFIQLPVNEG